MARKKKRKAARKAEVQPKVEHSSDVEQAVEEPVADDVVDDAASVVALDDDPEIEPADGEHDDDEPESDPLENVRWPDDPLIEDLPEEGTFAEDADFDSVDINLADFADSAAPEPVGAPLDEDFLIEPVDPQPEREEALDDPDEATEPDTQTRSPIVEAPDQAPVSLVTPVNPDGEPNVPEPNGPLLISVAGGKGGAGRSLLTANLGLFMAHFGRDVVACDLAPDGANLHTFLGMEPRLPTTGMMLRRSGGPYVEAFPGMRLRLCRSAMPIAMGSEDPLRGEALAHARSLNPQVLLLDLGTHADALTLDNFNDADAKIVVVTPEPIAMERTYSFLRAALFRRLLHGDDEPAVVARALLAADYVGQLDTPGDLVDAMQGVNPAAAEVIAERVASFNPMIVMNHCRSRSDREMGRGIVSALGHRWGIAGESIGALEHDDAAVEASRRRRPLMMEYPGSTLGTGIDRLARRLVTIKSRREAWS